MSSSNGPSSGSRPTPERLGIVMHGVTGDTADNRARDAAAGLGRRRCTDQRSRAECRHHDPTH